MNFKNKIDEYLKGELSDNERQDFIKKINDDKDFAHEVSLHEAIIESIGYQEQLRNRIDKIAQQRKWKRRIIQIGLATLIGLIMSLIFWIYSDNSDSNLGEYPIAEIFKVEKHHLPFNTKGKENFEKILNNLYKADSHNFIIEKIDSLEQFHPQEMSSEMKLYLLRGLAFYKLNKHKEAQENFSYVIEKGDMEYFQPYARYFTALSLLQQGNNIEARKQLETTQKLINQYKLLGFPFKEKLKILLKHLN